eukprot:6288756-Amphidinium_carterae.1
MRSNFMGGGLRSISTGNSSGMSCSTSGVGSRTRGQASGLSRSFGPTRNQKCLTVLSTSSQCSQSAGGS